MNLCPSLHSQKGWQTLLGLSLIFLALGLAPTAAEDLRIVVKSTTGERSKDSSSVTSKITADDSDLVWEQTGSGPRGRGKAPRQRQEFHLSARDKSNLLELIEANSLFVTESLQLPQRPPVFYFDISVSLTAGAQRGEITLSGPRSATEAREHALYRKTMILVKELYRIISAHDASIRFEEPFQQQP